MITQNYLKSVLDYDQSTGIFTWKVNKAARIKVGDIAGSLDSNGYVNIMIDGKNYKAHQLVFLYCTGIVPKKPYYIDHINRLPRDNRRVNLRIVDHRTNCKNKAQRWTQKSEERSQEAKRKRELFMKEQCLVEEDIQCGALL